MKQKNPLFFSPEDVNEVLRKLISLTNFVILITSEVDLFHTI